MFTRSFGAISRSDSLKMSQSKNCSRTAGQPGALVTSRTISPKNAIVLTTAISVLRPAPPPPRMREPRDPVAGARFGLRIVVRVRWVDARPGRRPRSYL
jgi:hypothetical protein